MSSTSFFRHAKIGTKVSAAMLLAVGGLFTAFVTLTSIWDRQHAEADAVLNVTERNALLRTTVEVLDKSLREQIGTYAKVFQARLDGQFAVDAEKRIDVAGRKVPTLTVGGKAINLDFAIPDTFTALTGAFATIFVRDGEDFVRVTTSHKKEDGNRAVGTALDHGHPAYRALLAGGKYVGSASLFGGQYMTSYEAIRDATGNVIGVLYVGINFTDSMRLLGAGIKSIQLGKTGGFYVINARSGKDLGKALVHRQREGENLLDQRDSAGNPIIQNMLAQTQGVVRYIDRANAGLPEREHIAAFTSIADWQLLLVGDAYFDEITATATEQRNRAIFIALVMVLIVTALLYIIIRKLVATPFGNALRAVEKVGEGDLTGRVTVTSQDESGRLLASLQAMTNHLSGVVGEVRQSTDAIAAVSAEVASGNLELSARTEQQAAALEQTASAMEQMNASVRQNADNARGAQRQAREASDIARSGGAAVAQVVERMDGIGISSRRIADITSVVDAIAFQTNILALNAAVEAARAGEQGRGFAVVATEVRTLAQRSSAAAKEIKQLINDSLDQVVDGAQLAARARATMIQVEKAIECTNTTIDEISAATQEQATGIEQINRAVVQLDEVTQKNAALVEEAAAAATTMKGKAQHLATVVQFFVVGEIAPK